MAPMFGDVTDFHQRHHPQNIPHLVEEMKGFPLKTKSFRNTVTSQKLKGGSINPPPPGTTVYHGVGMTFRVYVRGLKDVTKVTTTEY